jgi:NAD(P)-dependent dehydrogenase (short-subunit alcohol dehydrogenase family)
MEKRFSGKVALVIGGAQGIGKAVALRLASEGADVAIADIDEIKSAQTVEEIKELDGKALAYGIDLSNIPEIQPMVKHIITRFSHIDILVNTAGIVQYKPLLEVTEEEWDRIVDVNLKGMAFCVQTVAAQMVRQIQKTEAERSNRCHGKIVNFSSISGRRGRSLQIHYAASKSAVISITQSAALALAPYNINVNAVCPGVVPTRMWEKLDRERMQIDGTEPGQAIREFIERTPLKRVGSPEEIAGAVAFLCSADADYITGQTLNVDGGYEMN